MKMIIKMVAFIFVFRFFSISNSICNHRQKKAVKKLQKPIIIVRYGGVQFYNMYEHLSEKLTASTTNCLEKNTFFPLSRFSLLCISGALKIHHLNRKTTYSIILHLKLWSNVSMFERCYLGTWLLIWMYFTLAGAIVEKKVAIDSSFFSEPFSVRLDILKTCKRGIALK